MGTCACDVHASGTSLVSAEGEFDVLQLAFSFVDQNSDNSRSLDT